VRKDSGTLTNIETVRTSRHKGMGGAQDSSVTARASLACLHAMSAGVPVLNCMQACLHEATFILVTTETITTECQLCACTSLVWHGWNTLRYVVSAGTRKTTCDCESSVMFTSDVSWFLSYNRVISFIESFVLYIAWLSVYLNGQFRYSENVIYEKKKKKRDTPRGGL